MTQDNINVNATIDRPGFIPAPYRGEDWETMLEGAHVVQGTDQEKANELIGVPHVLVKVSLQPGDYRHGKFKDGKLIPDTGCGAEHPYMYLSSIIGPPALYESAVARGKVTAEQAEKLRVGDSIGYVEAGTGVYREVLRYLEDNGRLVVPAGPLAGPFGNSRFDTAGDWIGEWVCDGETPDVHFSDGSGDKRVGQAIFRIEWDIRLVLPRGLRASDYANEYTKEGRTRYFG